MTRMFLELDALDGAPPLPGPLSLGWRRLSLARQFTIAAFAVSLVSMLVLGSWVSRQIEANVLDNAAAATAVSLGHFIAPHLQELATGDTLSAASVDALDRAMANAAVKPRIEFIKIWRRDGRLVYSSNKALMGRLYPPDDSLTRAWSGLVTAEFDEPDADDGVPELKAGAPLLEVYAPMHAEGSGEVIAVTEFYERAATIHDRVSRARWQSWLITALLATAMIGSLFSIVADGSRTIERQRRALTRRIADLSRLLEQNKTLHERVERGARQATEVNERFLRQIGSDLHDGPAQLMGLALLRLDPEAWARADRDLPQIRGALTDALDEIRNICAGLLLPEAEDRSLAEALLLTIREHERRTKTHVSFKSSDLPADAPRSTKICLCRFVQEGLTNAFRHAAGKGQAVRAWADDTCVSVEVSDEGPGIAHDDAPSQRTRLGLIGLRGRIESIGGTMVVGRRPHGGTRLVAHLPVIPEGTDGQ